MGHVGILEKNLNFLSPLGSLNFRDFLSCLFILKLSYSKPFYNTLNYASTANIEEVMKLYNLGDKTFETDFSSKVLTSRCPMCEDQLDTQIHLFTCDNHGKELSIETFFNLSMTEENCYNLEKRLETREKSIKTLAPHPQCATDQRICVGTIIIIIIIIIIYYLLVLCYY